MPTHLSLRILQAMSTVNLNAVAHNIWPFLILMVVCLVFQVLFVLVLAPCLNPTHWFENGICVFGQSTGGCMCQQAARWCGYLLNLSVHLPIYVSFLVVSNDPSVCRRPGPPLQCGVPDLVPSFAWHAQDAK